MRVASGFDHSIVERADVLQEMTRVPTAGATICPTCHTWKDPERDACENCDEVADAIGASPLDFSLVTLYSKPSILRDWLTRYKGRPDDADPWDEESESVVLGVVSRFLVQHGERIEAPVGPFDAVVVVPSTTRVPPHPLEVLLARLGLHPAVAPILQRTTAPIGFRQPNPAAYRARMDIAGKRLYLVDDVYTTGAHLNSAAQALRDAGAEVVGALVIARRINPDYNDRAREVWDDARSEAFDWTDGPHIAGVPR